MFAARSALPLLGAAAVAGTAEHSCTKFIDSEAQYCHAGVPGTQSTELAGAAYETGLAALQGATSAAECAERCQAIGTACEYAQWSHASNSCKAFTKCWTAEHTGGALHSVFRCVAEPVGSMQWTQCTKPAVFTPPGGTSH